MTSPPKLQLISECFIRPQHIPKEARQHIYLSTWDLAMISLHYLQKGLLFPKPPNFSIPTFLPELKDSLSTALDHFYPLAARLATTQKPQDHSPSYSIYIDLGDSPGAKFIHAITASLTISDILSPMTDVPLAVQSFFDHDRAINHDGHSMPLLSVQVTELIDGIFIGCSMNHVVADGASFWHFFNVWSELFRSKGQTRSSSISRPPLHQRWIPNGYDLIINLPFTHHDQFIDRLVTPPLRERFFHFTSASLTNLKAKVNLECNTTKISTLQALSALMWRCVTRARRQSPDHETSCWLTVNTRSRLEPPLLNNYFGNSIETPKVTATAGELLQHGLGWAAMLLHELVANQNDETVRDCVKEWLQNPHVYHLRDLFDANSIMMGSSPRFDMYGNEFGLGKALAIRSGFGNKFDGKITLYPGSQGDGSMDLEVCLLPDTMNALESDQELMCVLC